MANHRLATDGRAPVHVATSPLTSVVAGRATQVRVAITADAGVSSLTTTLRGVRGVVVQGGGPQTLDIARSGRVQQRLVTVTGPAQARGYLVVDVAWAAAQQPRSGTTSFAVAVGAAPAALPALGRLEQGPRGTPVQVMPAGSP